jgi:hypothetical protein
MAGASGTTTCLVRVNEVGCGYDGEKEGMVAYYGGLEKEDFK